LITSAGQPAEVVGGRSRWSGAGHWLFVFFFDSDVAAAITERGPNATAGWMGIARAEDVADQRSSSRVFLWFRWPLLVRTSPPTRPRGEWGRRFMLGKEAWFRRCDVGNKRIRGGAPRFPKTRIQGIQSDGRSRPSTCARGWRRQRHRQVDGRRLSARVFFAQMMDGNRGGAAFQLSGPARGCGWVGLRP